MGSFLFLEDIQMMKLFRKCNFLDDFVLICNLSFVLIVSLFGDPLSSYISFNFSPEYITSHLGLFKFPLLYFTQF